MIKSAKMNFEKISELKEILNDHEYVEFIFHKFYDNPLAVFEPGKHMTWQYPECWMVRYYLYYILHGDLLKDMTVLDLGANFNFYSTWAVLHGAKAAICVEPDLTRYNLGKEYVALRNLDLTIKTLNMSIDEYIEQYQGDSIDVVFFLDVLYYLENAEQVLEFIKQNIKPKYLFLETTVVDALDESGKDTEWYPSTDTKALQSFAYDSTTHRRAIKPCRQTVQRWITEQGFEPIFYYDYHDFINRGESPPRKAGKKILYVLKNKNILETL